jgi:hypothetical protein
MGIKRFPLLKFTREPTDAPLQEEPIDGGWRFAEFAAKIIAVVTTEAGAILHTLVVLRTFMKDMAYAPGELNDKLAPPPEVTSSLLSSS